MDMIYGSHAMLFSLCFLALALVRAFVVQCGPPTGNRDWHHQPPRRAGQDRSDDRAGAVRGVGTAGVPVDLEQVLDEEFWPEA